MNALALSRNGIPIRLPDERWRHIKADHPELTESKTDVLEAISTPEIIFEGKGGELLAVRETEVGKWLVVAYRELAEDGFIITAFFTRRRQYLIKRKQLWP
jgi:hypothetical protein